MTPADSNPNQYDVDIDTYKYTRYSPYFSRYLGSWTES